MPTTISRRNASRLALVLLTGLLTAARAEALVTWRSTVLASTTGTSPTVAEPAGAAQGDVLIAFGVATVAGAITQPPSGWTQLFRDSQGAFSWVVSYAQRGASAPSSMTWGLTGSVYYEVHILALQPGVNVVRLDAVSAAGSKGNADTHNPDPPSVTALAATSLAVAIGANWAGSTVAWAHAAYTIRSTNTATLDAVMAVLSLGAPGAQNPAAFTGEATGLNDWWDGATITFTDTLGNTPQRALIGVGTE